MDGIIEQLQLLTSQAQTLRARVLAHALSGQNAAAAINKLPLEILSTIFGFAVGDRSLLTLERARIPRELDINATYRNRFAIRLTHVCKYWKDVACAQPLLWNTIMVMRFRRSESDSRSFMASLLRRSLQLSAPAPLHIRIQDLQDVDMALLQDLSQECGRLQSLRIDFGVGLGPKRLFRFDAPLLDRLVLTGSAKEMTLPTLFNGHTPSLTHVYLQFLRLRPSPDILLTTLTHLTLSKQAIRHPDDFQNIISLLRHSGSSLREVYFEACGADFASPPAGADLSPGDIVSLIKLQQLTFSMCKASFIHSILNLLVLPDRGIALDIDFWDPDNAPLASLMPIQRRNHWKVLQHAFTTLDLSVDRAYVLAMTDGTPAIRLRHPRVPLLHDLIPFMRILVPFSALKTLSYRSRQRDPGNMFGDEPWTTREWQDVFGSLTSLTTLFLGLSWENTESLCLALSPTLDGRRPYPAPVLRELYVTPPETDKGSMLVSLLEDRQATHHPVDTLRVIHEDSDHRVHTERKRQTYNAWETKKEQFAQYVNNVKFKIVKERVFFGPPRMVLRPLEDCGFASPYPV